MTDELQRNPLQPENSLYLGDLAIIQTNSNSQSLDVRVKYA